MTSQITDEAVEKAAQALHDHRALRSRALHEVGQPLRDSIYDDERRAEAHAALEAALPLIVREAKAEALEEAADALQQQVKGKYDALQIRVFWLRDRAARILEQRPGEEPAR